MRVHGLIMFVVSKFNYTDQRCATYDEANCISVNMPLKRVAHALTWEKHEW